MNRNWREVESVVHRPGRWLAFGIGAVFLVVGGVGFATIGGVVPPGMPVWIAKLGAAVFALAGAAVWAAAIGDGVLPVRVRHAAADVLPRVAQEPVMKEGSLVHGRLTHELWEDAEGWQLRPAERLWRNDKRFLIVFGIPFLTLFAGILAWTLHVERDVAGWPAAALCGIVIAVICGGSVFWLVGMSMRSAYSRLCRLSIPRQGSDLELELPEGADLENADVIAGLRWVFLAETKRQRLAVPRELVVAVELCPWNFVVGWDTTWAVQGLLVLARPEETEYVRLPILLTADFAGAAQLMERLAHTLQVPYLFFADKAGWQAEAMRSKQRAPLQAGGTLT